MMEHLDKIVVGGISAAVLALFRVVFTNNTKVQLLEQRLEMKEKEEDRRHEEVKTKIDLLVAQNTQAIENQQRIVEKLIEKDMD